MKIKLLVGLCFLLNVPFLQAQDAGQLNGKWKFNDVYEREKVDSAGLKMIQGLFGEMTLYFKENGRYKAFIMGRNDAGIWRLGDDGKKVTMTSDKGDASEAAIMQVSADQLVIKIGRGAFIMERTQPTAEEEAEEAPVEIKTVQATLEQVAKKWYMVSKDSPGKTEKQKQMANELIKGSYYIFAKNGKYKAEVLGIKEEGTWEFGENNRSIVMRSEGDQKIWNISLVTENELVLIKGNTNEKWTFSVNK